MAIKMGWVMCAVNLV